MSKKSFELPGEVRICVPPRRGWEENTLYLVRVSWDRGNPIHEAYLKVGFLEKGCFGGYCKIWDNDYEEGMDAGEVFYLKALKKLHTE